MITFTIPSVITVNHYWGQARNGRRYLTQRAKDFRFDVAEAVRKALLENSQPQMTGPLKIDIIVRWPDKRIRDCDNILKPLLDAIEHTGLIENDNQFKQFNVCDFDYILYGYKPYYKTLDKGTIYVEIYRFVEEDGKWEIDWEERGLDG